jgi:hypothetical protein
VFAHLLTSSLKQLVVQTCTFCISFEHGLVTNSACSCIAAALQFSGWPLDFEVVAAEKQLRAALVRDGLQPAMGYTLARYNEPTVPPFLRRNEVLIDLENYSWP